MPEHWSLCFTKNVFCYSDHLPPPFPMAQQPPSGPRPPHYRGFTITLRHTTLGWIPLDEWSARHRDLYLYNTQHSQQTNIHTPLWDSNPQSQQASALDRATTGTGHRTNLSCLSITYCSTYDIIWIPVTSVYLQSNPTVKIRLPYSIQELA